MSRMWTTTETFHGLYTKSKEAQKKFLNSLVKIELNPNDSVCSAKSKDNTYSVQEKVIAIDVIKKERNLGKMVHSVDSTLMKLFDNF